MAAGPAFAALSAFAALAALCLAACSTAPRATDAVSSVKNQAVQDAGSGDGYLRQGRTTLALQFYMQALSEYTSIDDEVGIITSYNAIGKTYMSAGSLDMAQDMFTRARERARTVSPALVFVSTSNLGELLLARADPAGALALFQEALAMPAAARTDSQLAVLHHNIGTALKGQGKMTEALASYRTALDINLKKKLNAEAASDYYMIASVYSLQGSLEEAEKNAQAALALDKRIENSPGIAQDLYALGLIAKKRPDLAAAFDYFQRSYLVATTVGLAAQVRKSLTELVAAADALGRTADADSYRALLADTGSP
jgi:tetratricopeptide (TPR) repeat protein